MKKVNIIKMVGISIMTAVVVVLQMLGSFIKIGPVEISLVLIPIVVGSAMYGARAGAFLGAVFGVVVIFQPGTVFFHDITVFGTVATVLVKGTLAGWAAGTVYKLVSKKSEMLGVILGAMICPFVNTGIFALCCRLFFWEKLLELGNGDAVMYLLTVMIGVNFLAEFATNLLCSPAIVRILHAVRKIRK